MQAASSGLVDFSEVKFFNKAWQLKLRLLLRGLHQENERRIKLAQHQHHCSLLGAARISGESFQKVQERAQDDLQTLVNLYRPWAPVTKEEREKEQVSKQRERWQRSFGDLDDAETQKRIEATAEALRRMREAQPPRSEMGDWFTVFNRQTANALEGMQAAKNATSSTRY